MKRITVFLLALMMVLALVPTVALADGETVNISTSAELMAAITNQQPGQTWNIAAGVYDISRNTTVSAGGQTGWYFPIVEDGITINGAGVDATVITSTVFSTNGAWASQDMIAVFGNNVTIQDLTVRPKMDTNKAIEIMGMDVTLKNVAIRNNNLLTHEAYLTQKPSAASDPDLDYWEGYANWFAGSVYFNPQNTDKDIGNATLDNVYVTQAWISCSASYVKMGTLTLTGGTKIDYRNAWYAPYSDYGVISKNPGIIVADDFTIIVDDTLGDIQLQVFDRMPLGTNVIDSGSTEVTAGVDSTYTIVIPAAVNMGTLQKDTGLQSQAFDVKAQNVIIEDGRHIVVSVTSPSHFKLASGTIQLGYQLFNGGASALASGGTFATFSGNGTQNGSVQVDTSLIEKAGSYQDTMTFMIAYQ